MLSNIKKSNNLNNTYAHLTRQISTIINGRIVNRQPNNMMIYTMKFSTKILGNEQGYVHRIKSFSDF